MPTRTPDRDGPCDWPSPPLHDSVRPWTRCLICHHLLRHHKES